MNGADAATGGDDFLCVLPLARLPRDADSLRIDISHYYLRMLGRRTVRTDTPFLYQAAVYAARERVMEDWNRTNAAIDAGNVRRACYLSMEFLMGRLLNNALYNMDLQESMRVALQGMGVRLEQVLDNEHDAGLGNGGLGRLAACFLDSCATLGLPVTGYGIRYQYGMFRQRIRNGYQVEEPDAWLRETFPWEVERIELARTVRFGGRCVTLDDGEGHQRHSWVDTRDVMAIPFDVPVPGYRNGVVNTLRLWSAASTDEFDLQEFNAGSYSEAVASKNEAENISMVLYPNTANESGHELRLRQQYFLVSASLQDVLFAWIKRNGRNFSGFADKHCFQLNDTHPAIAVPELMRLLVDVHGLDWNEAWGITRATMAYTNHTLLPEALETWPVEMFERLLPRLLQFIFEINARHLDEVGNRWPGDNERIARMSLIQEGGTRLVRMAFLAIVGSFSVNGVAELHSDLLRRGLFRDFAELWPEKFNNKTNGVTQRRWLGACNPALADLLHATLGGGWVTDLDQLKRLAPLAEDSGFHAEWRRVRTLNKQRLANLLAARIRLPVDPEVLFDVQVKRIHEYKRQLLNLLHVVHLYDRIRRGDGADLVPRLVLIGGKAAPGYYLAKQVIKAITSVARVVNNDPATRGRLQLAFFPDYNVSAMEAICPAADLSEQISTAGKEASGTGNMKFMMNGAVTIGTLDGANVEIREAVGAENFFLFGHTVDEVEALRRGYDPDAIIAADEDLTRVMRLLSSGHFNRHEPGVLEAVISAIRNPCEPWVTAADFRGFVDAQQAVEAAWADPARWTAMSIRNTAASGLFSTDRTMRDYNADIWRLEAVEPLST